MKIEWRNKARKQLRKIRDKKAVKRIFDAIEDYAEGKPVDIKALSNHHYTHRLRAGRYRVLMTVNQVIEITIIEEVKKRDERTY